MTEPISQETKWNALTTIVKRLPAQLTYYTSALGAIVLAGGGQLPPGLEFVAGGIGANLLSNLIDEVARGKTLPADELSSQVEEAVQKSDIANLLTKQDFLQGYARLIQRLDTQREISKEILTQLQSEFSTVARADQVEELKSLVLQIQSERVASVVGNMGNSKKRLDVFISSTKRDLVSYRDAVAKVVLSLGMYPIDMATFNPTSRNALQLCYDKVQEAEIFVGIYAHRYGYAPGSDITYTTYDGRLMTGDGETSITHWEYLWARERNLPLVLFIVGDSDADNKPLAWPVQDIEDDPGKSRLKQFKNTIMNNHVVGFFNSPDNLAVQVSTGIVQVLTDTQTAFGEVKEFVDVGIRIDNYSIDELIDEGGNGQVWRGREQLLDGRTQLVAIKLLKPSISSDPRRVERFKREISEARRFNHPNILRALDYGMYRGQFYVVMDYIEGKTLRHKLRGQPLPSELVIVVPPKSWTQKCLCLF